MAKVGRPSWTPPDPKIVEKLASQGMSQERIADALGICNMTLIRKKKQYSDFCDALKRGKALGEMAVTSYLMEACKEKNVQAIRTYLLCKCDWKETTVIEGLPNGKTVSQLTNEELVALALERKIRI